MDSLATLCSQVCDHERFTVFKSIKVNEVQDKLTAAITPHRLEAIGKNIDASLHRVALGDLSMLLLRFGAEAVVLTEPSDDFIVMVLILSGEYEVSDNSGRFIACAGDAFIIESFKGLQLAASLDFQALIVPLRRAAIARAAENLSGRAAPRYYGFDRHFRLSDFGGTALSQLLQYLIAQATAGNSALDTLATTLLIHHLLLNHSDAMRSASFRRAETVPYYVRRAEAFMINNFKEQVSLECLANHAGVSLRTLTAGFRRYCGASPLSMLREMRLERAREQLQNPHGGSVTEVALRFGFSHLGRFASVYRARFGECPSTTLAGSRA
jgi:AraC-like DNA-binding protein